MANSPTTQKAWILLLTNASYLPGTLVMYQCLQKVGTKYPVVVMVTKQLDDTSRAILTKKGIPLREIEPLRPKPGVHKLAEHDKRFEDTWTKLRVFELIEYQRVVMLDADMVIRKNMDELMDEKTLPYLNPNVESPPLSNWIAASHACACNPRKLAHYPVDWIPENCPHTPMESPDCLTNPPVIKEDSPRPYTLLNSGAVVLNPSLQQFEEIQHFLYTSPLVPTFSFCDQDLLSALYKGRWKVLPYIYNALKPLRYVHPKMWRDEDVKCVHYIIDKPWQARVEPGGKNEGAVDAPTHTWWWDEYDALGKEMNSDGPNSDPEGWKWVNQYVSQE